MVWVDDATMAQIRVALIDAASGGPRSEIRLSQHIAAIDALDAAAGAGEPFERRKDGALTIGDESFEIILHSWNEVITIHTHNYVDDDADRDSDVCEWTHRQARAVAAAILALAATTPEDA